MRVGRFPRTVAKLAWRDLRSSPSRAIFLLIALAVSIANVGGVRGAARVARETLHDDSRAWLAGDVSVTTGEALDDAQREAFDRLRAQGYEWTLVTWMLTMGGSDESADPRFLSVKAVDPGMYPFYGSVVLDPPQTLALALGSDSTAVSGELLDQLHVRVGDRITIGGRAFRISARIQIEPDRFGGVSPVGMRCMLSREAYQAAGFGRTGSPVKNRVLFRIPAATDLAGARAMLQELVPEGSVLDYHEANRTAVWTTETVIRFLGAAAWIALAIGTIGLTLPVRYHLRQQLEAMAVMKMLGGRSAQIISIFALQVLWIFLGALCVGVPLGWVVRAVVVSVAAKYLPLASTAAWSSGDVFDGVVVGLIAVSPVLAQPFFLLRRL
ncbi:MAG: FtsX-like permease family protein, partial [Bryobacteraceae bacterium]